MTAKTHRLCIFQFENGTLIHVVVPAFDSSGLAYSFDALKEEASKTAFISEETHGRGEVISFEAGAYVIVKR